MVISSALLLDKETEPVGKDHVGEEPPRALPPYSITDDGVPPRPRLTGMPVATGQVESTIANTMTMAKQGWPASR